MGHDNRSKLPLTCVKTQIALVLALLMALCLPMQAFAAGATPTAPEVKSLIEQVSAYQIAQLSLPGQPAYGAHDDGSTTEWMLIGLARGGQLPDALKAQYLSNLSDYLKKNGNTLGAGAKATDYARVVLALTALGVDARSFNGVDLTAPLTDPGSVTSQPLNGPLYSLLALGSNPSYTDFAGAQTILDQLTDALLTEQAAPDQFGQIPTGGWSWGFGVDPDTTGMALQALAPAYGKGNVDSAVDNGLAALSSLQDTDTAGFLSMWSVPPAASSASSAQALTALCALGIGADDARFVKPGGSLYDSLTSFLIPAGSGKQAFVNNVGDSDPDGMSTEQGLYALVAYYRALTGAKSLYDMSDVTLAPYTTPVQEPPAAEPSTTTTLPPTGDASGGAGTLPIAAITVVFAGAVAILAASRKRSGAQGAAYKA